MCESAKFVNDCEISMDDFNTASPSEAARESAIAIILETLGISVAVSADMQDIVVDYPDPEDYAELHHLLTVCLSAMGVVSDE